MLVVSQGSFWPSFLQYQIFRHIFSIVEKATMPRVATGWKGSVRVIRPQDEWRAAYDHKQSFGYLFCHVFSLFISGIFDNRQSHPVFDRGHGIKSFNLRIKIDMGRRQLFQFNNRRIANGLSDRVVDAAAAGLPLLDFDGDPRFIGPAVDIGADEALAAVPPDDFLLQLTVNGAGTGVGRWGDTVSLSLDSPGGALDGAVSATIPSPSV